MALIKPNRLYSGNGWAMTNNCHATWLTCPQVPIIITHAQYQPPNYCHPFFACLPATLGRTLCNYPNTRSVTIIRNAPHTAQLPH